MPSPSVLFPLAAALLWLQLWLALIPTWRDGDYYAYGWFVPPLALAFAWRRWQMVSRPVEPGAGQRSWDWRWSIGLGACVLAIMPLRLIGVSDPGWRPPILLQAGIVVLFTHLLLGKMRGAGFSRHFLPVTLFALVAVPLPWQLEQELVRRLTGVVVDLTREAFLLAGRPVEVLGERLTLDGEVVEVTDGCSGIRSLQSLGMAALFFGELLMLRIGGRLGLLAVAAFCAVAVNTARAFLLAEIHFSRGQAAADAAHDAVGHGAFALSALLLFLSAWLMQGHAADKRQIVRRRLAAPDAGVDSGTRESG